MTVGKRIKNRRKELGLTLKDVAERLGYSFGGLAKIERDEVHASVDFIKRIATVLHAPVGYFIGEGEQEELPVNIVDDAWKSFVDEMDRKGVDPDELREYVELITRLKKVINHE